jgi:lysophospholipase L1-like esterase
MVPPAEIAIRRRLRASWLTDIWSHRRGLRQALCWLLLPFLAAQAANEPPATLSDGPLRIVAFGDSTTAAAKDWAPEIEQVYADCLPGRLQSGGVQAEVFNAGLGDTTTRDAVQRLDRDVRSHQPQLVVVQFGINDSWIDVDLGRTQPRLTRAEFRNNLRAIIRTLHGDGARVVLMTPNPMRWSDPFYLKAFQEHPGLLDTDQARGIDAILEQYVGDVRVIAASEHVALVDIYQAFEAYDQQPGRSVNELLLSGDGIHPNQAGQALVCRLLADRLLQLLAVPAPARAHR